MGKVQSEALERLRRLMNDSGPSLSPYHDHRGVEQHDRLRADLQIALALARRSPPETGELGPVRALVETCYEEFDGGVCEDAPDEDAVMSGEGGDSRITFGLIRRARAALQSLDTQPTEGGEK